MKDTALSKNTKIPANKQTERHLNSIFFQSYAKSGPAICVRVVISLGNISQVLPEVPVYGEAYIWSVVR